MRILALITARGGSKRLPGKNIRSLGGKPLVVWSIDAVREIPEICDILVSTDAPEIATVCSEAGAYVPWLRPAELASDTAGSVDVALHALNWYETEKGKVDGLILLQPTSPFRSKETVRRGIELFRNNNRQSVIGVSATHAHPMWTLRMEGDYLVPYLEEHGFGMRSQDLPPAYVWNGVLFLISPEELRERRNFVGLKSTPLIIESSQEAMDIDTEWDWKVAETALNNIAVDDGWSL
jgi:CMP-N,N'-diacetyllegionaminic acid synthase